jgi:hypothetical protein
MTTTKFQLTSVESIRATMTTTMTIGQWNAIKKQLNRSDNDTEKTFARHISDLIDLSVKYWQAEYEVFNHGDPKEVEAG